MASATQTLEKAPEAKLSGAALYSRFALAGALCCSITHGALTPVDVYVRPLLPPAPRDRRRDRNPLPPSPRRLAPARPGQPASQPAGQPHKTARR